MALTLGTMETCTHALGTDESSCIGRPDRLFFMFEFRSPQESVGHAVEAPEASR
jgi:hypothetical protein